MESAARAPLWASSIVDRSRHVIQLTMLKRQMLIGGSRSHRAERYVSTSKAAVVDVAEVVAVLAGGGDHERNADHAVVTPVRGVEEEREGSAHSRPSSATAFLAQASSTSSLPSAAARRGALMTTG
jgi:hypothetical protein